MYNYDKVNGRYSSEDVTPLSGGEKQDAQSDDSHTDDEDEFLLWNTLNGGFQL